jgi:putative nucleotidyltransferase with HDIG domain
VAARSGSERGAGVNSYMRQKTTAYVIVVTLIAIVWGALTYQHSTALTPAMVQDALILSVLAIAGEMLSFMLPRSAAGSIAFIPYFASAIVVPGWPSVAFVVVIRASLELMARRTPTKAVFNVSQQALMQLVAIHTYVALGGVSLLSIARAGNLTVVTRQVGASALAAFIVALFVNTLLVATVISLTSGRSIVRVWLENHRATMVVDVLATTLAFVFGWVYAAFGAIAAAALWVPILGLRQVHRTNLELEQTNEELLELMVKSLEARDPYTSGHSRRVQHYSAIIARAIGLNERQIEEIGRAALLHDVGKIYEKYAYVLTKQDKLTPEEWAVIQEHSLDGANLVSTMSRLRDIVPAILHHHENWDGTGYPQGLAGEIIPLSSRIIRFADTIDAMTTERPYRRPLTDGEVRAEVVRCRGTQFDPAITDRLLSSPMWSSLFAPTAVGVEAVPRPTFSVIGPRRRNEAAKPTKTASEAMG